MIASERRCLRKKDDAHCGVTDNPARPVPRRSRTRKDVQTWTMKKLLTIKGAAIETLCVIALCGFSWSSAAAVQDSRFSISPDGRIVELDIRDVSRKEVLDRLVSGRGITIEWRNSAVGDERITGRYNGSLVSVARQLLAPTDFVMTYGRNNNEPRLSHVLVIGPANDRGIGTIQGPAPMIAPGPVPVLTPDQPPNPRPVQRGPFPHP